MTRADVASRAAVRETEVREVTVEEVRRVLPGKGIDATVLAVATQEPATYWLTKYGDYYLDDPHFGPPIRFDMLAYDPATGLHDDRPGRGQGRSEWDARRSRTGE